MGPRRFRRVTYHASLAPPTDSAMHIGPIQAGRRSRGPEPERHSAEHGSLPPTSTRPGKIWRSLARFFLGGREGSPGIRSVSHIGPEPFSAPSERRKHVTGVVQAGVSDGPCWQFRHVPGKRRGMRTALPSVGVRLLEFVHEERAGVSLRTLDLHGILGNSRQNAGNPAATMQEGDGGATPNARSLHLYDTARPPVSQAKSMP